MSHLPPSKPQKSGQACVMRVVRVSGTIRKAEEELIRRGREEILRAKGDTVAKKGNEDILDSILGMRDGAWHRDEEEDAS